MSDAMDLIAPVSFNTAAKADAKPAGTEIAIVSKRVLVPTEVYRPGALAKLLDDLAAEARQVPVDISTEKGRKAVKSLVYNVARSKTALDAMGKTLGEDARKIVDRINADRKVARDRLDALGEEIRKPLTDYEAAEAARIAAHEAAIAAFAGDPPWLDQQRTSAEIQARLDQLRSLPPREWQEFALKARDALAQAIEDTETALTDTLAFEAQQAEAARLAQEAAAAAQEARDARIRAEAEQAARAAIEAAERRAAQAEQDRIDTQIAAAQEAEARQARMAAETARAIADEQARAQRVASAEAAAQVARAADVAHRRAINGAALAAMTSLGITEEQGKALIAAIAKGDVPHVSIRY
jgi:colicin import membrane protein